MKRVELSVVAKKRPTNPGRSRATAAKGAIPLDRRETAPERCDSKSDEPQQFFVLVEAAAKERFGDVVEEVSRALRALGKNARVVPLEALHGGEKIAPGADLPPVSFTFRRRAEYWTLGRPGDEFQLRNSKGLQHIACLLRHSGRDVHVLDLVGVPDEARATAGTVERARVNATRTIRDAVRRIARHDPRLGHHLAVCIKTGAFCAYRVGPQDTVRWEL